MSFFLIGSVLFFVNQTHNRKSLKVETKTSIVTEKPINSGDPEKIPPDENLVHNAKSSVIVDVYTSVPTVSTVVYQASKNLEKIAKRPILIEERELITPNDSGKIRAQKSAKSINGSIVKPGEVFSFNQIVGQITPEEEFLLNENNRVMVDIGASVWRVSTAVYQAAKDTGLEITERHTAYQPLPYTKISEAAIVNWGDGPESKNYQDIKFKNNKDYCISIECMVDDKAVVTVKLYKL